MAGFWQFTRKTWTGSDPHHSVGTEFPKLVGNNYKPIGDDYGGLGDRAQDAGYDIFYSGNQGLFNIDPVTPSFYDDFTQSIAHFYSYTTSGNDYPVFPSIGTPAVPVCRTIPLWTDGSSMDWVRVGRQFDDRAILRSDGSTITNALRIIGVDVGKIHRVDTQLHSGYVFSVTRPSTPDFNGLHTITRGLYFLDASVLAQANPPPGDTLDPASLIQLVSFANGNCDTPFGVTVTTPSNAAPVCYFLEPSNNSSGSPTFRLSTFTFVDGSGTSGRGSYNQGSVDLPGSGNSFYGGIFVHPVAGILMLSRQFSGGHFGLYSYNSVSNTLTLLSDVQTGFSPSFERGLQFLNMSPSNQPLLRGSNFLSTTYTNGGTIDFEFVYPIPTTTSGPTPNHGPQSGGTDFVINGADLFGDLYLGNPVSVKIGGVECDSVVSNVGGTQLACTSAQSPTSGLKSIVITTPWGKKTLTNVYTYDPAPTITSVTPNVGPFAGGQNITIAGANFFGTCTVEIDGIACTNVVVNAGKNSITCKTDRATVAGTFNVVVTSSTNGVGTLTNGYTYQPPPLMTVISANPAFTPRGPAGATITLTGTNFLFNDITVKITTVGGLTGYGFNPGPGRFTSNEVAATNVNVLSDTQLEFDMPFYPFAGGHYGVVLHQPDQGYAYGDGILCLSSVVLQSITPNTGPLSGGANPEAADIFNDVVVGRRTRLQFAPDGLSPVQGPGIVLTACKFGGVNATIANFSSTPNFWVYPPAHAAGAVDVYWEVDNGGCGLNVGAYSYEAVTIDSINPDHGLKAGGNLVTILGRFMAGVTTVTFGGISGIIQAGLTTATQLTVKVPASPVVGPVDVVVNTVANGSDTVPGGYTYETITTVQIVNTFSAPVTGDVTVQFNLIDEDLDLADVNVEISYALVSDPNVGFTSVTLKPPSLLNGLDTAASPGALHQVIWNSAADMQGTGKCRLKVKILSPADSDGNYAIKNVTITPPAAPRNEFLEDIDKLILVGGLSSGSTPPAGALSPDGKGKVIIHAKEVIGVMVINGSGFLIKNALGQTKITALGLRGTRAGLTTFVVPGAATIIPDAKSPNTSGKINIKNVKLPAADTYELLFLTNKKDPVTGKTVQYIVARFPNAVTVVA